MAQNKYSNDVFFEPWVGQEYYSGIKVDDNGNFEKGPHKEKGQEPEKGFYRVMILGLEHYCNEKDNHCENCNIEQEFYTKCLDRINSKNWDENNQKDLDEVVKEIEKLEKLHEKVEKLDLYKKLKDEQKYKDKIYVLCKKAKDEKKPNLELDGKSIDLNVSNYDVDKDLNNSLLLSMAIEKVLTVNTLWDEANKEKAIIEIAKAVITKPNSPCNMHKNACDDCSEMHICRQMTKREIYNFTLGVPESKSHGKFREAFFGPDGNVKDWHYLSFFNFFQKGMPYTNYTKNAEIRKDKEIEVSERQKAVKAFIEVITTLEPNVIISWETKESSLWTNIFEELKEDESKEKDNKKIQMKYTNRKGKKLPTIKIELSEEKNFTILEKTNNKQHKMLISFLQHPAARNYNKELNYLFIRCFSQDYGTLKQWTPNKKKKPTVYQYKITGFKKI